MYVLQRKEGQEVRVTHQESGDVLVIKIYNTCHGSCRVGFLDDELNFEIQRPESPRSRP